MKALVTGATGFVGSHLVDALLTAGWTVTALARSASKAATLSERGVRVVAGHLHLQSALVEAIQEQDVVYHVAGAIAARGEADFLAANREGTRNVVTAARMGNPHLVLVSSLAAGGPSPRGTPLDGSQPARPVTAYGRSKLEAERVVRESPLRWSIVRPPVVYGPRDREVFKVFRLVRLSLAPVFGDGTQELSAVHAVDLARALVAVGTSGRSEGQIYHACHPEIFTSAGFVQAVAAAMGRRVRIVRVPAGVGRTVLRLTEAGARLTGQTTILTSDKANEFFQPAWTGDPTSLMRDCGWEPSYDLGRGLADTYQWYRQAGWL